MAFPSTRLTRLGGNDIIALAHDSDVALSVTSPSWSDSVVNVTVHVLSQQAEVVSVPVGLRSIQLERTGKGVSVSASGGLATVSVILREAAACEGYMALPVNALGTEYYIITHKPFFWTPLFDIAAYYNNTEISIILSPAMTGFWFDGVYYAGGSRLVVNLNGFETLQIQTGGDPSSTHVTSSEPVAVFAGNQIELVGNAPLRLDRLGPLVEQLVPVSMWGRFVFVVPAPGRNNTIVRVMVRTPGNVFVFHICPDIPLTDGEIWDAQGNGAYKDYTFPAGTYVAVHSLNENCTLQVVQFIDSDVTDPNLSPAPAMTYVPSLNLYRNSYRFTTPPVRSGNPFLFSYILVTVEASQRDGLRLDSNPLPGTGWTEFVTFLPPRYLGMAIQVSPGVHVIEHLLPNVTFGAVLYGSGETAACTYAYPAGYCLADQVRLKSLNP